MFLSCAELPETQPSLPLHFVEVGESYTRRTRVCEEEHTCVWGGTHVCVRRNTCVWGGTRVCVRRNTRVWEDEHVCVRRNTCVWGGTRVYEEEHKSKDGITSWPSPHSFSWFSHTHRDRWSQCEEEHRPIKSKEQLLKHVSKTQYNWLEISMKVKIMDVYWRCIVSGPL